MRSQKCAAGLRIHPAGRFVEKDHRWPMEEGAGKRQTLSKSPREFPDDRRAAAAKTGHVVRPVAPLFELPAPQAIGSGPETDVLIDCQIVVERKLLRHVADASLDLGGLGGDVETGHGAAAGVGLSRPHSIRMTVVLPAPFEPRKPKISPGATSKDTRSTATKSPKTRVRSVAETMISGPRAAAAVGLVTGRRPFAGWRPPARLRPGF